MKILLVEPWLAGSHLAWAQGYGAASGHEVGIVGLPGQLWRWRLRGGALPLSEKITTWIDIYGPPDLLLVSGLVDVAELLGLARRNLPPNVAVVVYQHESQLVYPVADGQYDNGAALRNWMSWCVADLVLFNSYHHLRAVTEALPSFLAALPDDTHTPQLESVLAKFEVAPVGVDLSSILSAEAGTAVAPPLRGSHAHFDGDLPAAGCSGSDRSRPPVILWPHRWERDKDPEAFLRALNKLEASGLEYQLVLAGQQPPGSGTVTAARQDAEERFGHRIVASGDFERADYLHHLARADLVVSCARHEFFGVAVVEAIAAGAVPLLPNALAYPELIRPPWHRYTLYEPGTFGTRLVDAVARIDELAWRTADLAATMGRFDWSVLAPIYDQRLEAVRDRARQRYRLSELCPS